MGLNNRHTPRTESVAISQRMGDLFDDLMGDRNGIPFDPLIK
jgi:hypothetical protein